MLVQFARELSGPSAGLGVWSVRKGLVTGTAPTMLERAAVMARQDTNMFNVG
jgi:hypothetical protein